MAGYARGRTGQFLTLGATFALVAVALISATSSVLHPQEAVKNITVVYVGAEDCPPCQTWRRDRLSKFMESPEYQRLVYREVNSPKLFDVLSDEYWPDDLRRYRSTLDRSAGVPLWFIIGDGTLLMTVRGLGEWDKTAVPKIRSLTH